MTMKLKGAITMKMKLKGAIPYMKMKPKGVELKGAISHAKAKLKGATVKTLNSNEVVQKDEEREIQKDKTINKQIEED